MLWENIISNDFPEAVKQSKGVCVVPVGCLEKHGAHSPLGTDTIIAAQTAIRAAEIEPVVVFPTMYFGEKSGSGEFPGTVIFSMETRWHMYRDMCNEIYRNGFDKILFYNGHGGNKAMLDLFARSMLSENPHVQIFNGGTNCGMKKDAVFADIIADESLTYLTDQDRAELQEAIDNKLRSGHACIIETAKAYHFFPETVRLDLIQAECGDSTHRYDVFTENAITSPLAWGADFPNSYGGSNNYKVNERTAKAITEYYINKTAEHFRFLKNETVSTQYHAEWLAKQQRHEF